MPVAPRQQERTAMSEAASAQARTPKSPQQRFALTLQRMRSIGERAAPNNMRQPLRGRREFRPSWGSQSLPGAAFL